MAWASGNITSKTMNLFVELIPSRCSTEDKTYVGCQLTTSSPRCSALFPIGLVCLSTAGREWAPDSSPLTGSHIGEVQAGGLPERRGI